MLTRRQTRRPAGANRTAGKEGERVPDEEEIVCVKDITKTNLKGDLRMKRSVYEAPVTDRFQIELESGFCSGSADVENPKGQNGEISEQEVNTGFTTDFTTDSDTNTWD